MSGIVRIESSQDGTGFLINRKENTINIITANHVVAKDDNPKIYFSQDKNLKGTLHHIARKVHSQLENDLALLRIVTEESQKNFFDQLFIFTIADSSSSLKENSMVSTIGIPEYKKILDNECKIVSADKNEILFSSDFVAPGYSGGPLIGDDQQVLGMLREGLNANIHKAIPAEVINNFLKEALKKEEAQKEKALCKEAINNVQNLLQRHTQSISSHKIDIANEKNTVIIVEELIQVLENLTRDCQKNLTSQIEPFKAELGERKQVIRYLETIKEMADWLQRVEGGTPSPQ